MVAMVPLLTADPRLVSFRSERSLVAELVREADSRSSSAVVVPLRDIKTRELLPGRTIMDIGPKVSLCCPGASVADDRLSFP